MIHISMKGMLTMIDEYRESQLSVNDKWCKGCGICVQYCPKKVLEISHGKVRINDLKECIRCRLCEQRCPDYAIFFRRKDNE